MNLVTALWMGFRVRQPLRRALDELRKHSDVLIALWAVLATAVFVLPPVLLSRGICRPAMGIQSAGLYIYVLVLAICLVYVAIKLTRRLGLGAGD